MYEYKQFFAEAYPTAFSLSGFEKIRSFAGKYRYAAQYLQKIASGSGRTVFKVDEEKVLKIAKNKKGLAQNSVECEKYLQNYDIVAKTFEADYDNYFWVEMELAKKIGKNRFKELTGVSLEDWDYTLVHFRMGNKTPQPGSTEAKLLNRVNDTQFAQEMFSLVADYDMHSGDMSRLSTFGEVLRDGEPKIVLVDFGLTNSVFNDFYKVSFR